MTSRDSRTPTDHRSIDGYLTRRAQLIDPRAVVTCDPDRGDWHVRFGDSSAPVGLGHSFGAAKQAVDTLRRAATARSNRPKALCSLVFEGPNQRFSYIVAARQEQGFPALTVFPFSDAPVLPSSEVEAAMHLGTPVAALEAAVRAIRARPELAGLAMHRSGDYSAEEEEFLVELLGPASFWQNHPFLVVTGAKPMVEIRVGGVSRAYPRGEEIYPRLRAERLAGALLPFGLKGEPVQITLSDLGALLATVLCRTAVISGERKPEIVETCSKQTVARLHDLAKRTRNSDLEIDHHEADLLLCDFLGGVLGFHKVVSAYLAIPKGYTESTPTRLSRPDEIGLQSDPQAVVSALESLSGSRDLEEAHYQADQYMCELLTVLGFEEIALAYGRINKGYGVIKNF